MRSFFRVGLSVLTALLLSLGSGFSPIWWTPPAIATEVVDDTSVTVSATPSSVTVQRSGNYGLSGWALRVPAHEAYIRDSYSPSWKTVFQRDIKVFDCLLDREAARCRSEFSYSGAVL
jgi:hypothetical protein